MTSITNAPPKIIVKCLTNANADTNRGLSPFFSAFQQFSSTLLCLLLLLLLGSTSPIQGVIRSEESGRRPIVGNEKNGIGLVASSNADGQSKLNQLDPKSNLAISQISPDSNLFNVHSNNNNNNSKKVTSATISSAAAIANLTLFYSKPEQLFHYWLSKNKRNFTSHHNSLEESSRVRQILSELQRIAQQQHPQVRYVKVTRRVLSYKTCGRLPGSDAPAEQSSQQQILRRVSAFRKKWSEEHFPRNDRFDSAIDDLKRIHGRFIDTNPDDPQGSSPEELGKHFEGDIVLFDEQAEALREEALQDGKRRVKRKFIAPNARRWNPGQPIEYSFDGSHS